MCFQIWYMRIISHPYNDLSSVFEKRYADVFSAVINLKYKNPSIAARYICQSSK